MPVVKLPARATQPKPPRDVVREWTEAGKPLPLEIMLVNMVRAAAEADRLQRQLKAAVRNGQPDDASITIMLNQARAARDCAQRYAADCAPYFHGRRGTIGFDPEAPVQLHLHAHAALARLADKSDQDLARMYGDLVAGNAVPELLPPPEDPDDPS